MSILNDKTLIKRQYIEGVNIFKEGAEAEEAYLIHEGKVRIFINVDGTEQELAILEAGEIFGEMSRSNFWITSFVCAPARFQKIAFIRSRSCALFSNAMMVFL